MRHKPKRDLNDRYKEVTMGKQLRRIVANNKNKKSKRTSETEGRRRRNSEEHVRSVQQDDATKEKIEKDAKRDSDLKSEERRDVVVTSNSDIEMDTVSQITSKSSSSSMEKIKSNNLNSENKNTTNKEDDKSISNENNTNNNDTNSNSNTNNNNTSSNGNHVSGIKRSREEMKEKILESIQQQRKKQKQQMSGGNSSGGFVVMNRPTVRYSDLGGIEHILQDIRELIEYPFTHPEIYQELNVEPPRGILLYGPPGSGKTMLASAIAGELNVPFLKISAPEIVSGMSGESEAKIRSLFKDAVDNAPSIVFIDEIDAITPKRETASKDMERRIVAQLLTCMDQLSFENTGGKMVTLIGATNRPDSLDPALRRAGRFDREISLGIPDENARTKILQVLTQKLKLCGDFDFKKIAKLTPGFVGADLHALTKEAAICSIDRIFKNYLLNQKEALSKDQLNTLHVEMNDFEKAISKVQPSATREGFATIPNVSWQDIGALEGIHKELKLHIMDPIQYPERYEQLGQSAPVGVLLYGPPGCGKTMVAKAIANSSGANFISIKGPELLNKFVGESERAIRQVFARARASAPCIIFFDELDAVCPKRGYDAGNAATERVVNQLLTELDGLDNRKNVFAIAATNRPDIIDPAMLRPGRLDKLLYVSLPSPQARVSILKTLCRKTPIDEKTVNLEKIATDDRCNNFSGADLSSLVREAAICCLQDYDKQYGKEKLSEGQLIVRGEHFENAFSKVFPSISEKDRKMYEKMAKTIQHDTSFKMPTNTAKQ